MDALKWRARTVPELMIEAWEALDCESVGRSELEQIQQALVEKFGAGAIASPATIARTLADEGAVLRHPEVFECDCKWRAENLAERNLQTHLSFSNLAEAVASFGLLEAQRQECGSNAKQLDRLRNNVKNARNETLFEARSRMLSKEQREEAKEISEWLSVWLSSPQLFPDWLDLRMRAGEFRKKFKT